MCGIFAYCKPVGYLSTRSGLTEVIKGLVGQVNRGQEGVGLVAFNPGQKDVFSLEKTDLSVDRIVNDEKIFERFQKLNGQIILGHNRYATHGSISDAHAQPMQNNDENQPLARRKAIIFNGNIANESIIREELERKGVTFTTDTDTEVLLKLIVDIDENLTKGNAAASSDYEEIFRQLDKKIDGACSLVLLDGLGNVVFYRDKNGIRPFVYSELEGGVLVAASETSVLESYNVEIQILEPGHILWVNSETSDAQLKKVAENKQRFCTNEILYLSRPSSEINSQSVYSVRYRLGETLANMAKPRLDLMSEEEKDNIVVTPVPSTGIPYAIGMAEGLKVSYQNALVVRDTRRSFINAKDSREKILKGKHTPIRDLVEGKTVWCVDDTIIRSSTARVITEKLRAEGARGVEWFVGAPTFKGTCHYGLSVPSLEELAFWKANRTNGNDENFRRAVNDNSFIEPKIAKLIGADKVTYLTVDQVLSAFSTLKGKFCAACFDLQYPTPEGQRLFDLSAEERSAKFLDFDG